MTMPFRLAVLKELTDVLKTITPDNGYTNDMSAAVFRGRSTYGEYDPLPMLSILEDPRNIEQDAAPNGSPSTRGSWSLLVQGFVNDDDEGNPTDQAYWLLAEAKKALLAARTAGAPSVSSNQNYLGFGSKSPCVMDIRVGAGVVRPADEFSAKAYFWLPVTLDLAEDHSQPFT